MQTSNLASQLRRCLNAALSSEFIAQSKSRRRRLASQAESRSPVEVNTLEPRILLAADLGDAPSPYPVTLAENGAQHTTTGPTLGANRDSETNGAHSATATADDTTGAPDDEDGVTFGVIRVGQLGTTVTVNVQNAPSGAKLDAWIDFDQDGSWGGPFEQIASNLAVVNGNNTVSFDVPSWALDGTTFGRFRLSTAGNLAVTGLAANGEVEDHAISITQPRTTVGDFGSQLVIASGTDHKQPNSSQAADFDGDGDMDVVSSFENSNLIQWFENNGTESFTPHTISAAANGVQSIFADDLDGDGDVDVVAAIQSGASPGFAWYDNTGNGTFTTREISSGFEDANALSCFVADMDRDGDMDVLGTRANFPLIAWYENDGNQNFIKREILFGLNADDGVSVVASDVDGDGDMDVVAALANGGVSWYENNGSQTFSTARMISATPMSSFDLQDFRSVFAADIDGDGDIDIAAAGQDAGPGDDGHVVWYENNGSQVFTLRVLSNAALGANSVFVADLNGDGRADVLAASTLDSKVRWFRNDGGGVFTEKLVYSKGDNIADYTWSVFASDIDSDGDLDVLTSIYADNKVVWFRNLNGLDFGDAPTGYPVTLAENGARHLAGGPFFGTKRDTESDGTHSAKSDADDLAGVDDEDGISIDPILSGGTASSVNITASAIGKVDAWVDFNEDGDWLDPGEQIFSSLSVGPGTNNRGYSAPTAQVSGSRNARFRISTTGGLAPTGEAMDGEVDDLRLFIQLNRAVITGPATPTASLRPTMTWNAVPGATQYNVNVTYRSTNTFNYHLATVTGTSYTPTVDFGIGDYSYTVQAVNPTPDGPPSPASLPYRFYIKAPVSGLQTPAVQANVRPTLTWNALPGAVKYDVWIDNLTTNQTQFIRNTNVPTNSFTPSADLPFGNYRAWVRGIDASGTYPGAWPVPVNFSIVQLPAPVITQGQNPTFDRTPTFAWNAVSGAGTYDVVIRSVKTGTTVVQQRGITDTSWTPSTPLADGPYFWWVSALTPTNARGVWTQQTPFYVGGRTDILSPIGTISDTTPTFNWRPVDGVDHYDLWVDRVGGARQVIREQNLTSPTFTANVLPAGTYRAWVRAISSTNELSPWSAYVEFTIADTANSGDALLARVSGDDVLSGVLTSLASDHDTALSIPTVEAESTETEQSVVGVADIRHRSNQFAPSDRSPAVTDQSIDIVIVQWMMNPMGLSCGRGRAI